MLSRLSLPATVALVLLSCSLSLSSSAAQTVSVYSDTNCQASEPLSFPVGECITLYGVVSAQLQCKSDQSADVAVYEGVSGCGGWLTLASQTFDLPRSVEQCAPVVFAADGITIVSFSVQLSCPPPNTGLSTAAIVGIVIAVLLGVGIIVLSFCCYWHSWCCCRCRARSQQPYPQQQQQPVVYVAQQVELVKAAPVYADGSKWNQQPANSNNTTAVAPVSAPYPYQPQHAQQPYYPQQQQQQQQGTPQPAYYTAAPPGYPAPMQPQPQSNGYPPQPHYNGHPPAGSQYAYYNQYGQQPAAPAGYQYSQQIEGHPHMIPTTPENNPASIAAVPVPPASFVPHPPTEGTPSSTSVGEQ